MLLIQASNIHVGGGATLLRPLLQAPAGGMRRRAWVDTRFDPSLPATATVDLVRVHPSLPSRVRADAEIARSATPDDLLLCLGNLPPLRRPGCKTVLYLQNRYLIGPSAITGLPLLEQARLLMERAWLRTFVHNADLLLVQTPSMQLAACEHLGLDERRVLVTPYLPDNPGWPRSLEQSEAAARGGDTRPFLYVASGEAHKNHRKLIEAWVLLAREGLFPALQLTLDAHRFSELAAWIGDRTRAHGLHVVIDAAAGLGSVAPLYQGAQALIYPSRLESFGLPLMEARQAGLPVIAAELDYVRDLLDPEQSFAPDSARSIARAVKRFMGIPEAPLRTLDAEHFLQTLLAI